MTCHCLSLSELSHWSRSADRPFCVRTYYDQSHESESPRRTVSDLRYHQRRLVNKRGFNALVVAIQILR